MLPLVGAMYEVAFVLIFCRINLHFTGHISKFIKFAEAFANKVASLPLARLLRECALYQHGL